jgi:hypothetical protein
MARPDSLPVVMASERKIRLAVGALLSDPDDLPEGLYCELAAFRDMLHLRDMQRYAKGTAGVADLLADTLRDQVRDGVLKKGMPLPVTGVARAYDVGDEVARTALDALAAEHLLACGGSGQDHYYVVTEDPHKVQPRSVSEASSAR